MSDGAWGALVGAAFGGGVVVLLRAISRVRTATLADRVLPYLRDVPPPGGAGSVLDPGRGPGPRRSRVWLETCARLVGRALGGNSSIERRLQRAGSAESLADFRRGQALWGLVAFAAAAVPAGVIAIASPERSLGLLGCCLIAFVLGVLLRENRLTAAVARRERAIAAEFPSIAELLALAVAAGEGPVAAVARVVERARGPLAEDLRGLLSDIHLGAPIAAAFDAYGARSGVPIVARFAEGVAVAIERGTPLAEVLHAQAGDVREAGRRALIESGARREVLMMVPVVFLVLPTVVVFAFWPGLVGLRLVVP